MPRQTTSPGGSGSPGSERRKHARVKASVPSCLLLGSGQTGDDEPFDLVDLSESGVRLRCRKPLGAMTQVRVAMVLPGRRVGATSDVRFETTGVVVWSHRQDPKVYDTGVFFPEIDDRQRGLLRTFVTSHP